MLAHTILWAIHRKFIHKSGFSNFQTIFLELGNETTYTTNVVNVEISNTQNRIAGVADKQLAQEKHAAYLARKETERRRFLEGTKLLYKI